MSLTSKLISKSWLNGFASFEIEFTDDNTKEVFTRSTGQLQTPGDNLLPVFVAHVSRAHEAMRSYFDSQVVGDVIAAADLGLSADDLEAEKFFRDISRLKNLRQVRDSGDTELTKLEASIKRRASDHPEYAEDPRWPR